MKATVAQNPGQCALQHCGQLHSARPGGAPRADPHAGFSPRPEPPLPSTAALAAFRAPTPRAAPSPRSGATRFGGPRGEAALGVDDATSTSRGSAGGWGGGLAEEITDSWGGPRAARTARGRGGCGRRCAPAGRGGRGQCPPAGNGAAVTRPFVPPGPGPALPAATRGWGGSWDEVGVSG